MKTSTNIMKPLSTFEMRSLAIQIPEIIADVTNHKALKTFSAANLWNIQRKRKKVEGRKLFTY